MFLATGRQAFYARFSRKARSAIHALTSSSQHRRPLIILTGGMRSPATFHDALSQGHADLIGIGRGSVLAPNLPVLLKEFYSGGDNEDNMQADFPSQQPSLSYADTPLIHLATSVLRSLGILPLPSLIGAGAATAWYAVAMRRISRGRVINYQMGAIQAIFMLWFPELQALTILFCCWVACYTFIYVF